jgi:uncharacterized protein (TIGR02246 family)
MTSDEQEIRQLVANWIGATKAGDTSAVLDLMTDDVVFLVTGHPPLVGKAAFAAATKAQSQQGLPHFEGQSEIQEVKVLGDWAYMWTRLTVAITLPGGAPTVTRSGHTLSILRKVDGKWALARDANMLARIDAT